MIDEAMLRGKVALVTGSGRGMGRAHAVILAQHGADVVVHDIVPDRVAESAGIVRQHGNRVLEAVTDVADPAAMEQLVKRIEKDLGPISILVNNAGIGADRAVTEAIDEAMFDRMFFARFSEWSKDPAARSTGRPSRHGWNRSTRSF